MKTEYTVRAFEEELGSEYFIITVPEGTSEEEVYANLEMAGKYASINDGCKEEDYDKHFKTMVRMREECCGTECFEYYLKKFCKYKVKCVSDICDYEFEW